MQYVFAFGPNLHWSKTVKRNTDQVILQLFLMPVLGQRSLWLMLVITMTS